MKEYQFSIKAGVSLTLMESFLKKCKNNTKGICIAKFDTECIEVIISLLEKENSQREELLHKLKTVYNKSATCFKLTTDEAVYLIDILKRYKDNECEDEIYTIVSDFPENFIMPYC